MIAPDLMGHVAIPSRWKEFLFHRGCSSDMTSIHRARLIVGGKGKEGRQAVFFTPLTCFFGDKPEEEEFNNDVPRPIKVHYNGKWKPHQDVLYWIHLARAQERRLFFGKQGLTPSMITIQCPPTGGDKI